MTCYDSVHLAVCDAYQRGQSPHRTHCAHDALTLKRLQSAFGAILPRDSLTFLRFLLSVIDRGLRQSLSPLGAFMRSASLQAAGELASPHPVAVEVAPALTH